MIIFNYQIILLNYILKLYITKVCMIIFNYQIMYN